MKKRTWFLGLGVIIVIALVVVWRGNGEAELVYESVTAERADVARIVDVTGHFEPAGRIDLAFTVGGRVAALPGAPGMTVDEGDPVAMLDGRVLASDVNEARARLSRERAVLVDLIAPLRGEERALKDSVVTNAEVELARAEHAAQATIARAFTYADDAIHEEADELFQSGRGDDPSFGVRFTYGTTDYILRAQPAEESLLAEKRQAAVAALAQIEARQTSSAGSARARLNATDDDLVVIEQFLAALASAVNSYIPDDINAQTVYESFQTTVAAARTAIATARSDVATTLKDLNGTEAALSVALDDLDLSLAGAAGTQIMIQEAAVAAAAASVLSLEERLVDTVLVAPVQGTIVDTVFDVGETVSPYQTAVVLFADGAFEIEVYVPEADIADVSIGDSAVVTLDAFDTTDIFAAQVVDIALTETVRDGVPTYKTRLGITEVPEGELQLRPGMTADVEIATGERQDVIAVPTRSIVYDAGRTYVRVVVDGELVERAVETGLRGSDGTTEIVSGLREGDEVVLFVDES